MRQPIPPRGLPRGHLNLRRLVMFFAISWALGPVPCPGPWARVLGLHGGKCCEALGHILWLCFMVIFHCGDLLFSASRLALCSLLGHPMFFR